jgi:NTP pyrophosphatase (non-canonical NTP hydrolase)
MSKINWNELRDCAYKIAYDHGFHEEKLSDNHYLMLVMTELSKAIEADRKKKHADLDKFNSCMNKGGEFWRFFIVFVKDSVGDELADAVIRLLDFAGRKNIDLSNLKIAKLTEKQANEDRANNTFTDFCFDCCRLITECNGRIDVVISFIYCFAKLYDIDLLWYINQKMRYNELRPYKHGKKY